MHAEKREGWWVRHGASKEGVEKKVEACIL